MKRKLIRQFAMIGVSAAIIIIAACSTAKSNREAALQTGGGSVAPADTPAATPQQRKEVKALHLSLELPAEWTTVDGEESFAFQKNGTPAGGLDGLGYSDSVEGLLPNGALVESQKELTDISVKTVEVKVSVDGQGEGEHKELHYFYFLPEIKVVYDLHFDPGQLEEDQASEIARTAVVH